MIYTVFFKDEHEMPQDFETYQDAKEYAEETAIKTKIEAYLELGASKEKTIKVLMEQYNLTEQTAIEKYNEYAQ